MSEDFDKIYDLIKINKHDIDERFDYINRKFDDINEKFDMINTRLTEHGVQLDDVKIQVVDINATRKLEHSLLRTLQDDVKGKISRKEIVSTTAIISLIFIVLGFIVGVVMK